MYNNYMNYSDLHESILEKTIRLKLKKIKSELERNR